MKKISALSATILAAVAVTVAPTANASTEAPLSNANTQASATTTVEDDAAPTLTFYTGAMGNMLNCGGTIAQLWCKK